MVDHPRSIELEAMFMALADRTRLRLLSMMADGEVCVFDFTDALGVSQPKVSRHLAYLRNAGLVDTRREGKWIYYSIRWPEHEDQVSILNATLKALPKEQERSAKKAPIARSVHLPEPDPYREYPPSRPVHNDLDEFLL